MRTKLSFEIKQQGKVFILYLNKKKLGKYKTMSSAKASATRQAKNLNNWNFPTWYKSGAITTKTFEIL